MSTLNLRIPMTPAQSAVLRDSRPTLMWIGGRGCAKTVGIAQLALHQSLTYPRNRGFIASVSGPHFKRVVVPEIHEKYEEWGLVRGRDWEYNAQDSRVSFTHNGSFYYYVSLDLTAGELKGMNAGWGAVDEAELCTLEQWEMLEAGVRKPGTAEVMRGFCNPPPAGHWIEQGILDGRYAHVHTTTYENPVLTQDYLDRMHRMYPPGTPRHARWMLGKIGVPMDGAVYPEFDPAVHLIDELPHEPLGFINGLDFGYSNPLAFLPIAVASDDTLYVVGEHYAPGLLLRDHATQMRAVYRGGAIYADHDTQDRKELELLGLKSLPARKEVDLGIELVRRRLQDRKLFVVRGAAPNLVREFGCYVWEPGTMKRDGKGVPRKKDDHAMDALRYAVAGYDLGASSS